MEHRGRTSAAALSVVPTGGVSVRPRLAPPSDLEAAERQVWLETVNARPADWFGPEHRPLLTNMVRHAVRADMLDVSIKGFDPDKLATDTGFRHYERLVKMFRDESKAVSDHCRAMRMTHQSLYQAKTAGNQVRNQTKSAPWETEEE